MSTVDFARRYDQAIFDAETRALYEGSDFYNVGDWSDGMAGPPSGLGEAARRLVERHLSVDPPHAAATVRLVLDIGCGLGPTTRMMARHYPAALVLGINLSAAQASHAAVSAPSAARFAAMDANRLAIACNSVDRIHSVEAAFHFDTRLDFLREAHRVLRPDGKLVLTDILYRRAFPDVPIENLWTDEADYRTKCVATGFVVESYLDLTDCTVGPFCNYVATRGNRAYARVLRRAVAAYSFIVLHKTSCI